MEPVDHFFRHEAGRMVAVLTRIFGVHNIALAEDAVQETFLAALTNVATFSGNSTKKTWLTGILNHKVCDQLRNTCRNRSLFRSLSTDHHCETDAATLGTIGFVLPPRDPRTELESKELREALQTALQKLPPRQARVSQLYQAGSWSGRENLPGASNVRP